MNEDILNIDAEAEEFTDNIPLRFPANPEDGNFKPPTPDYQPPEDTSEAPPGPSNLLSTASSISEDIDWSEPSDPPVLGDQEASDLHDQVGEEVLLQPRKPVEEPKDENRQVELSPADKNALSCVQIMHKSVRTAIFEAYKDYRHLMKVPKLDAEWENYCQFSWPVEEKLPESQSEKNKLLKYPGLLSDLELQDKHRAHQLEAAPMIKLLNSLYDTISSYELPPNLLVSIAGSDEGMIRSALDALQLQGDHIARITMQRRENFINLFSHLKPHMEFVKNWSNYSEEETRTWLFRKTFLNNLMSRVNAITDGYQKFTGAVHASKKMLPSTSTNLDRYSDIQFGSPSEIRKMMNLPVVEIPFHFSWVKINYLGGRLLHFYDNWCQMTSNRDILQVIQGHNINFFSYPVPDKGEDIPKHVSEGGKYFIKEMIKQNIVQETREEGICSSFFLIPKEHNKFRFILNLKEVNKFVVYKKFKMQSVSDAMNLLAKNDFMVKIDLKQAYDCVPISHEYKKFLQFRYENKTFHFNCLPNGLSEAPRLFTRLLDPIKYFMGSMGVKYVSYLDDLLIINNSAESLRLQASLIIQIFTYLGFSLNQEKSCIVPSQSLEFLGYVLDSQHMTITLTQKRMERLQNLCKEAIQATKVSRRMCATLLGHMTSAHLAISQAPIHYRELQRQVILVEDQQEWDNLIQLSLESKKELSWWIAKAHLNNSTQLKPVLPDVLLFTDASFTGWGAVCRGEKAQGPWTQEQLHLRNINILEMMAIKFGLMALLNKESNICIKILTDNKTALFYLIKKGGTGVKTISDIALDCWHWAISRQITLIASHIPGVENSAADQESRVMRDPSDFQLSPEIFQKLQSLWGPLKIDLFASLWNRQVQNYYAWMRQPEALGMDALSIHWQETGNYAFPPWILIPKVIQKIRCQQVELVLITPMWPKKNWYSHLTQMSTEFPILLPDQQKILKTVKGDPPKLDKKFNLVAWKVSGIESQVREFQRKLQKSSQIKTGSQPGIFMNTIGNNGIAGAIEEAFLPFQHL